MDLSNDNDLLTLELAAKRGQLSSDQQLALIEALRAQATELEEIEDNHRAQVADEVADLERELSDKDDEIARLNGQLLALAAETGRLETANAR